MKYVKLANDPQYWYVINGRRMAVNSPDEMYSLGLLPVEVVTSAALDAIPILGDEGSDEEE